MSEPKEKAEFITHLLNGNNAFLRDEVDTAIKEYMNALELNPHFYLIMAKLGQAYYKKGDFVEAVSFFQKSLEMNPEQPDTLYHLGKAYHSSGMDVQAAVAYDMAMEKDRAGDYTSAIESRKRRIRQHSSGRSLNELKAGEIVSAALKLLAGSPSLMIPPILAALILIVADSVMRRMTELITHTKFTPISLIYLFRENAPDIQPGVFLFYICMMFVLALLCAPLYGACIVASAEKYRKRKPSIGDALVKSFSLISPIGGFGLVFVLSTGVVAVGAVYILKLLQTAGEELMGISLPLLPLTGLVFPVIGTYLVYALPCIVLEKQQMENAIKKAVRYGVKYTLFTAGLLLFCTAFFYMLNRVIPDVPTPWGIIIKNHVIVSLITVPIQTFVAGALTIVFLAGREMKRKKKGHSSSRHGKTEEQQDDLDEEPEE